MASSGASAGAIAKKFPLQLAIGVLKDLLSKELDTNFAPDDEGRKAAFAVSRESLPRRLALLIPQIGGVDSEGAVQGFCTLVTELWSFILSHPSFSEIRPCHLQSSLWLETLSGVFKTACAAAQEHTSHLLEGGAVVQSALAAIGASGEPLSSLPPARVAHIFALVEWWGDEVSSRKWTVLDAWGCSYAKGLLGSPLHVMAAYGLAAFVPLALRSGYPVNGDFNDSVHHSPAMIALKQGHVDVIEVLLDQGLDLVQPYKKDGWPLALMLFVRGKGQARFLSTVLRRKPEIVAVSAVVNRFGGFNLLGAAIRSDDPAIVDLVLAAGAPVEHRWAHDGAQRVFSVRPTLADGLDVANPQIMELLIVRGKVLEGWREKYEDDALGYISESLARLAVSAFPCNPHYRGDPQNLARHNPRALACLEMVLASGTILPMMDPAGKNALLTRLYPSDADGKLTGCILPEEHALSLLKEFHHAGFDVSNWFSEPEPASEKGLPLALPPAAVASDQPDVLDWSLGLQRTLPDPVGDERTGTTLLTLALTFKSTSCALLLLNKYKVRAAYPDQPLKHQPILHLMVRSEDHTEDEIEKVLAAMIERCPSLFNLPCFSDASIFRAEEAEMSRYLAWNPVFALCMSGRPRSLEFLMKKNLLGVAAMVHRPTLLTRDGYKMRVTPAQVCSLANTWDCMELLLRYTDARVTDAYTNTLPAAEYARRKVGSPVGPSRALQALVEARAKKELAAKAQTSALSQAAGAASNAFEEPPAKPLTEKEEKAKAKKKAAKKKAKAKKRAAANAGAGSAAPAVDGLESDDSSSDDDAGEPVGKDDVDARYAPDFDALAARMAAMKKE